MKIHIGTSCFNIKNIKGYAELSKSYYFTVEVIEDYSNTKPTNLILATAILEIGDNSIYGVITKVIATPLNEAGKTKLKLRLTSRIALAIATEKTQAFINKTTPNIVCDILTNIGYLRNQLIFNLKQQHKPKPYRLQISTENNLKFIQRLLEKSKIHFWFKHNTKLQEEIHLTDNFSGFQKNSFQIKDINIISINNNGLQITSNNSNLHPGDIIKYNDKDYIIKKIYHYGAQNIENASDSNPYSNKIILCPQKNIFHERKPSISHLSFAIQGDTESNINKPELNKQGYYHCHLKADLAKTENRKATPVLARIQPAPGWHTPLHKQSEILLSTTNNNIDSLIILGTLPNNIKTSPVTAENSTQSILRTANYNEMVINENGKLTLDTHKNNTFQLDKNKSSIKSRFGSINWQAKQDIAIHSDKIIIEKSKNRKTITSDKLNISSTQKNIYQQAKANYNIYTKHNVTWTAKNNIELKNNNTSFKAAKNILLATKSALLIEAKKGAIQFAADNNINIIGKENISIMKKNSGIKISNKGIVDFFGESLLLHAQAGVYIKGNLKHNPTAYKTPAAPPALTSANELLAPPSFPQTMESRKRIEKTLINPLGSRVRGNDDGALAITPKPIHTLVNKGNHIRKTTEKLVIFLNYSINNKNQTILTNSKYKLSTLEKPPQIYQGYIINATITIENIDLSKSFKIELFDPETLQVHYITGINNKNRSPTQSQTITLQDLQTEKTSAKKTLTLTILHPPIICNLRKNEGNNQLLNHETIDYYKQNGNNTTIFIHGYNVPFDGIYGSYGKNIKTIKFIKSPMQRFITSPLRQATAITSGYKETILRNKTTLQQNFSELIPWPDVVGSNLNYKEKLNGTGAHSWFLWIEDNLNTATGRFNHRNYNLYTRIINVTWPGDPHHVYDYIDAVQEIENAGIKLTEIVTQLVSEEINVNIIAHSLGCGVLLHAMNRLPKNSIEHAFLWQAATPNNVLTEKNENRIWNLPNAVDAAKQITILYSNNDNILGPIPSQQHNQTEINRSKPLPELILGLFLTNLDLHSIYELSMWIGIPASDLLKPELQQQIYDKWVKKHPNQGMAKTLSQQITKDEKQTNIYQKLREKLIIAQNKINRELIAANHPILGAEIAIEEFIFEHLNWLRFAPAPIAELNKLIIDIATALPAIKGALALLNIMLNSTEYKPRPALGYAGPANIESLKDKVTLVNQTPLLWEHSGMKIPTKQFLDRVYKTYIINKKHGIKRFGKYNYD